ncbi:MAG: radical SAM protein [Deltaproteobacteria bacterium]|nr:radical SAM protein [Candidatus Zymogenaceae bacterium]
MEHLTISLFLTVRCSSRCRHCGAWETQAARGDMTKEEISRLVAMLKAVPAVTAVGMTGGEVFVVRDLLHHAVSELREAHLPYTFTTNAYWAKDFEMAKETLSDFIDTIGIGFSTDSFHQEYIPLMRVVNAVRAAEELSIPYNIRVTTAVGDDKEKILTDLIDAGIPNPDVVGFAPVMYLGQAKDRISPEEFPDDNPLLPCLSLRTPFVFSGGALYACCGEAGNIPGEHPLYLGNVFTDGLLPLFAKYDTDSLLRAVYDIGPRAMWELLGEEPTGERERLLLRSPCGTCRLLFEDASRTKRVERVVEKAGNK